LKRLDLHEHQPVGMFEKGGFATIVFREALNYAHWQFASRWLHLFDTHCDIDVETLNALIYEVICQVVLYDNDDVVELTICISYCKAWH